MTHIVVPNWLIYLTLVLTTISFALQLYGLVLRRREAELDRKKAEATILRLAALRDRVVGRP